MFPNYTIRHQFRKSEVDGPCLKLPFLTMLRRRNPTYYAIAFILALSGERNLLTKWWSLHPSQQWSTSHFSHGFALSPTLLLLVYFYLSFFLSLSSRAVTAAVTTTPDDEERSDTVYSAVRLIAQEDFIEYYICLSLASMKQTLGLPLILI
jgi:hypothetical protein